MSILATRAKWQAYKQSEDADALAKKRECKSELAGTYNAIVLVANLSVGVFVASIIMGCFSALALLGDEPLKAILTTSLWTFVACYGGLTLGMLIAGYGFVGRRLHAEIKAGI